MADRPEVGVVCSIERRWISEFPILIQQRFMTDTLKIPENPWKFVKRQLWEIFHSRYFYCRLLPRRTYNRYYRMGTNFRSEATLKHLWEFLVTWDRSVRGCWEQGVVPSIDHRWISECSTLRHQRFTTESLKISESPTRDNSEKFAITNPPYYGLLLLRTSNRFLRWVPKFKPWGHAIASLRLSSRAKHLLEFLVTWDWRFWDAWDWG